MQKYFDTVLRSDGRPAVGATIAVTVTSTGLAATIYSDNGVTVIPGSTLTADASGEYNFYAANNKYTLTTSYGGYVTEAKTDVMLFDIAAADTGSTGFWPDVTSTSSIWRARDRLFVGVGAASTGNKTGTQGGIIPLAANGANWASRDSVGFFASSTGLIALSGVASNASIDTGVGMPTETIGVGGFVIGSTASRSVWGLYSDVQFEAGSYGYGCEFAIKNKGADVTTTPYFATTGTYGLWVAAGGDPSYGGAATANSNTAILIGKNNTQSFNWNRGLVFLADAISGTDGTTGTGTAIEMAKGQQIVWRAPGNYTGFIVRSDITTTGKQKQLTAGDTYINMLGNNSQPIALFKDNLTGVNYPVLENATTGNLPVFRFLGSDANVGAQFVTQGLGAVRFASAGSGNNDEFRVGGVNSAPVNYAHAYGSNSGSGLAVMEAKGTDTNVSLRLLTKGTGTVSFGSFTSNADTAVTGYILITDAAGNQRKLATIA
jgi:hypothetical protein